MQVLNMSELTMLPKELQYEPLTNIPLWFHKDVIAFPREIAQLCAAIENEEYDLVLFEVIPSLNNFFPDELRSCLKKNYTLHDTFMAPRKEGDSFVEVYIKPKAD